jgi:hypothetical protein
MPEALFAWAGAVHLLCLFKAGLWILTKFVRNLRLSEILSTIGELALFLRKWDLSKMHEAN